MIQIYEDIGTLSSLKEAHVVRDCKILGFVSKKGRRYLEEAVAKAAPLYEGKPVYFDHPTPEEANQPRAFIAKFGTIKNVRMGEDGLRGDFHFNPKHMFGPTFEGWLETDPSAVGFSHNAYCQVKEGADGQQEVTEIISVESVDLVATPATTNGLFEGVDSVDSLMPVQDVAKKEDPVASDLPTLDEALSKLIAAILADGEIDKGAKRDKILIALDLMDDGDEKAPSPAEKPVEEADEDPSDEEKVEESDEDEDEDEDEDKKDEMDKKTEEAVARFQQKVGVLLEEAFSTLEKRLSKVKAPVSLPPARAQKELTVDILMEAIGGKK